MPILTSPPHEYTARHQQGKRVGISGAGTIFARMLQSTLSALQIKESEIRCSKLQLKLMGKIRCRGNNIEIASTWKLFDKCSHLQMQSRVVYFSSVAGQLTALKINT